VEVETSEIEPDRERISERSRRHHREVSETPEPRASGNAREERLPPEPKADLIPPKLGKDHSIGLKGYDLDKREK